MVIETYAVVLKFPHSRTKLAHIAQSIFNELIFIPPLEENAKSMLNVLVPNLN